MDIPADYQFKTSLLPLIADTLVIDSVFCTCKAEARLTNRGRLEAAGRERFQGWALPWQAGKAERAEFAICYSLLGLHFAQD